jgi:hypothetical protein
MIYRINEKCKISKVNKDLLSIILEEVKRLSKYSSKAKELAIFLAFIQCFKKNYGHKLKELIKNRLN